MKLDRATIKAYDIRGVVPDQLDAAAAEQVGRAVAAMLTPKQVVVGRDVRLTGPELQSRVIAGLTAMGVDVVDIGVASTDLFYFSCATKKLPGIMVTASHNPSEYNGFKMVRKMPQLLEPKDLEPYIFDKQYPDAAKPGTVTKADLTSDFLDRLLEIVPPTKLKPLKVVIDTSNGAQGALWQRLEKRLPITIVPLFFEPDGHFPHHGNDVIQPQNQDKLRQAVLAHKADLGLIFDPDGDRCLAVDDHGVTVPGDFLTALMGVSMLQREPGGTIIYDVRASDVVPQTVMTAGGTAVVCKVGHTFFKPKMAEHRAIFGGEVSGHFYFKDFWYGDCGLLAGLVMLEYVSGLAGKFSQEIRQLQSYYHLTGEINSKVKDVPTVLARLKQRYHDAEIDELDGVAVRYPTWHFVVRASNTEPLLRLTLEADSAETMAKRRDEVLALIRS
jgi:phosphomannomutase